MEKNGALCPAYQDTDIDVCKSCFKRVECKASRKFINYIKKVRLA